MKISVRVHSFPGKSPGLCCGPTGPSVRRAFQARVRDCAVVLQAPLSAELSRRESGTVLWSCRPSVRGALQARTGTVLPFSSSRVSS